MTQGCPFREEELPYLTQLAELYLQIKPIILLAEELDEASNANLQVIKELRDAFDHLMRVIAANTSGLPIKPDYAPSNLRAARSHLLRASFDALDGLIHILKQRIANELIRFDRSVLFAVIPNYADIKRDIETISRRIADYREKKDAGDLELSVELIEGYLSDVDRLKSYHDEILDCLELLDQAQREKRQEQRKSFWMTVWVGIGCAILGVLLGKLL